MKALMSVTSGAALAALAATVVGWAQVPIKPEPVPSAVLRLVITTCDGPPAVLPATLVQVIQRRGEQVIGTQLGVSDSQGRVTFTFQPIAPCDSALVTIHPPGYPARDSDHRYRYRPGCDLARRPGVWDFSQSLTGDCHDSYLPNSADETIVCKYRPSASTE